MTAREESVLPPIDPSIADENDWWEFTLTDVKVLRPGKMLYANLLEASEQNPVQVIGCLELKPNQVHLALDPDLLTKRILIDDVTHYAYGQAEDRSVQLWVAGKAGWYRVSAAKGYMPYFNRMVQAVDMYYFLMDKHKQGKKQINPTFKNLCEQYIYHTHGDCETRDQSADVFAAHASFLLRCMIEDDLVMEWNKTNVFLHLRRQFHEEYRFILNQRSLKSEAGESEDEHEESTPRHDSSSVVKSQAAAIYQMMMLMKNEGKFRGRRGVNFDTLVDRLSDRYRIGKDDAYKIVCARASDVLKLLDEKRDPWARRGIYKRFKDAVLEGVTLPPSLLIPLEELEESSDEDSDIGRIQKSVLRPKATSMSSKLMGKRNPIVLTHQLDGGDSDEQGEMSDIETPSKSRGHELIRTPLPASSLRSRSTLSEPGPAAAFLQSILQETPQPPQLPPKPATVKSVIATTSEPLRDLDQFLEPEIWICSMVGCPKTITTKGIERQKDIKDHAGEHDWETQMRVELVETEQRMRSVFPVGNLMQYLISQHYQQMRTAFPEVYPAKKETGDGNNPTESPEAQAADSPTPSQLAETHDHEMNGATT